MRQRGRKSAASLTVIGSSGIETVQRPEPPAELSEEQAAEWQAMVNRLSADWFPRETWPLLVQYCRHVVSARRVAQLIARAESDGEQGPRSCASYMRPRVTVVEPPGSNNSGTT
jgi:hypothetical protein